MLLAISNALRIGYPRSQSLVQKTAARRKMTIAQASLRGKPNHLNPSESATKRYHEILKNIG